MRSEPSQLAFFGHFADLDARPRAVAVVGASFLSDG